MRHLKGRMQGESYMQRRTQHIKPTSNSVVSQVHISDPYKTALVTERVKNSQSAFNVYGPLKPYSHLSKRTPRDAKVNHHPIKMQYFNINIQKDTAQPKTKSLTAITTTRQELQRKPSISQIMEKKLRMFKKFH